MTQVAPPQLRLKGQANGAYLPVGVWMSAPGHVATTAWLANLNILCAHPMPIPRGCTLDRLGVNQGALADAGNVRLGVYRDNGSGKPGALVLDAGTVALNTSAAAFLQKTISQVIATADDLWIAGVTQGHTSGPSMTTLAADIPGVGVTGTPASAVYNGYTVTGVSGALPDPFGASSTTSNCPRFWWRASA